MTTHPQPVHAHRLHVNSWLIAVSALAAALVALGSVSWVLVDRSTGAGGSTQKATVLIDKLFADLSAGKVDAATALFTHDAIIWQSGETKAVGTAQVHQHISGILPPGSFTMKRIAPVSVHGNIAATFSNVKTPVVGWRAIDVFLLRGGKIAREWDFELGSTPPFDNGVRVP